VSVLEDDVVEAAVAGDRDAVDRIYRHLSPRVLAYVAARGVDDPEGTTDDVMVTVFSRLARLHGGSAGLRTLTFSVAHARVVDDHRARARRPLQVAYEPQHDTRAVESAEASALGSVATQQAEEMLAELGEEQRSVVMLRVMAGLSLEETAQVLGRSVGSVKQLQRRELLRLREIVDARTERRLDG
jgi:RNA polymerase sigma-70 factor (ECF subfamily)